MVSGLVFCREIERAEGPFLLSPMAERAPRDAMAAEEEIQRGYVMPKMFVCIHQHAPRGARVNHIYSRPRSTKKVFFENCHAVCGGCAVRMHVAISAYTQHKKLYHNCSTEEYGQSVPTHRRNTYKPCHCPAAKATLTRKTRIKKTCGRRGRV